MAALVFEMVHMMKQDIAGKSQWSEKWNITYADVQHTYSTFVV
jgi:hypothetical protein